MVRTDPKKVVAEVNTPDFVFAAWIAHVGPQVPVWTEEDVKKGISKDLVGTIKPALRAYAPGLVARSEDKMTRSWVLGDVVIVRKKWAYIYVETISEARTIFQEIYIDAEGKLWKTSGRQLYKHDRGNPKSKGFGGASTHRLPRSYKGKLAVYYVAYTDRQLQLEIISLLGKSDLPELTPPLVHGLYVYLPRLAIKGDEEPASLNAAVGIDLLSMPLRLNRIYNNALRARENWVANKAQRHNEGAHLLYAEQLLSWFQSMPKSFRDKFEGHLDQGRLQKDIARLAPIRTRLQLDCETTAAQLCKVLDSDAYGLIRTSFRMSRTPPYTWDEDPDYAVFHYCYAKATRNLKSSGVGQAYLLKKIEEAESELESGKPAKMFESLGGPSVHYVNMYILPSTAIPTNVFKMFRFAGKSTLSILSEYIPAQLMAEAELDVTIALLQRRIPNFSWDKFIGFVECEIPVLWFKEGDRIYTWHKTHLVKPELDALTEFLEKREAIDRNDFGRAADVVKMCFDAINIALALRTLQNEWGKENTDLKALARATTDLMLHVANIASSLTKFRYKDALSKSATTALRRLTIVTGGYSVAMDLYDAHTAARAHDFDKAAALAVAAAGEAMATFGAIAGQPVIAVTGGVVLGVGYIWSMLGTDSTVEHYLKHCEYGRWRYLTETKAPWTIDEPISEWRDNYLVQLRSLLYIAIGMGVTWRAKPLWEKPWYYYQSLEVFTGEHKAGMWIESRWKLEWTDPAGNERLQIVHSVEDGYKYQSELMLKDGILSYSFKPGPELDNFFASAEAEYDYWHGQIRFTAMTVEVLLHEPRSGLVSKATLHIVKDSDHTVGLDRTLTASSLK